MDVVKNLYSITELTSVIIIAQKEGGRRQRKRTELEPRTYYSGKILQNKISRFR